MPRKMIEPQHRDVDTDVAVVKNSILIIVAQVLGVGFGLLFDILIVASFGIGVNMDAMFVALTLPQIVVSVFVSIGIRVFSPLFSEAYENGGNVLLATMFSGVVNYMFLILSIFVFVGIISAPWLVAKFGLPQSGKDSAETALRILYLSLLPLGMVESIKSLLVNQGFFFLSALSNFLKYSSGVMILLIFRSSVGIMVLPWAYVAGSYIQLLFYITLYVFMYRGLYQVTFGREANVFSQMMNRLGPPMTGELIGQSNILVEIFFASFLSPGVVSIFGYGRRFLAVMNGLIANSIVVAALPRLSREAISNQLLNLRHTVLFGVQFISLVTGYLIVVFIASSKLFETLLLNSERLPDMLSVEIAVILIIVLGPSLFFMGVAQIFVAPFYAFGQTKIIMYFRILFLAINFLIAYGFVTKWGARGLAFALVISLLIQTLLWLFAIARKLQGLGAEIYWFLARFVLVIILLSLSLRFGVSRLGSFDNTVDIVIIIGLLSMFVALLFGLYAINLRILPAPKLVHSYTNVRDALFRLW